MPGKTDAEVIIGGKVFTLSGYESEEYLQKVASYINNKLAEYSNVEAFKRQAIDIQNVLLQINIADDYFKAKHQISMLEDDISSKEKTIYNLKHEIVAAKMKLDNNEKTINGLKQKISENEVRIARMETELKNRPSRNFKNGSKGEAPGRRAGSEKHGQQPGPDQPARENTQPREENQQTGSDNEE